MRVNPKVRRIVASVLAVLLALSMLLSVIVMSFRF